VSLRGVTVNWINVPYDNLYKADDCYWYAIQSDDRVVFISNAHFQYIDILIKLNVKDFDLDPDNCTFWLGYMQLSDFARMDERLVKDIEALLIIAHKPFHNSEGKEEYWGQDNIYVRNMGCPVLKEHIRSEDKQVLDTKFDTDHLDLTDR